MRYVDSHTEGEPTRVILDGGPDLGDGTVAEKLQVLRHEHDYLRRFTILEPRGFSAIVGALLCRPSDPNCQAGVIFFNNTGYLGMCGHGAIGVAATLAYLGRIETGTCRLETPVGPVDVEVLEDSSFAVTNVPSYRYRTGVEVDVAGLGRVSGDIAWGGNWFFLTTVPGLTLTSEHIPQLTAASSSIRHALEAAGITGSNGGEIDHIELIGPAVNSDGNARNFVLCPGGEYDRSPCGTGTSAKVACLAADEKLQPGQIWVQESVIGSSFRASYRWDESGQLIPTIQGRAFVCADGHLVSQVGDPLAAGMPSNRIAQ